MIQNNEKVLSHLEKVLNYNYDDEKEDMERAILETTGIEYDCSKQKDNEIINFIENNDLTNHIFYSILVLQEFYNI